MFRGTNTGFNGTTTFTEMTPSEEAFAEELIAYWLSFVRTYDPNKFKFERSPTWEKYSLKARNRLVLHQGPDEQTDVSGSRVEPEDRSETDRCEFVASISRELEA